MSVDLDTIAVPTISEILRKFDLIKGLFESGRFSAVDGIIEGIKGNLHLLRSVDNNTISVLIVDLNDIKDENLKGSDADKEDIEFYINYTREALNKLKDEIEGRYRARPEPELELESTEKFYGRIMSESEFKALEKNRKLVATDSSEDNIPVFEAPPKVITFFMEDITKDKAHNLIQALGGSGNARYIVIFKTRFKPVISGLPSKHLPLVRESKFASGTGIEIVRIRKI